MQKELGPDSHSDITRSLLELYDVDSTIGFHEALKQKNL